MAHRRLLLPLPALAFAALLFAGAWVPSPDPGEAPSAPDTLGLAEVLDRHAAATGGREALDSLRTLDVNFLVIEPTFAVEGRYRATMDGRVRVDAFAGDDRVYSEGIDSAGAWKQEGPEAPVEPLSREGEAALRHGIAFNLVPLHRFPERGHELAYRGRERLDDRDYHVVQATLRDGFEARLFLDPESWLVARRREQRALHPDEDGTATGLETIFRQFREVCGVRRATRTVQVDLATGDTVQATHVLEQSCNRPPGALGISRKAKPEP